MVPVVVGPADLMAGFGGNFGVVWPELVSFINRGEMLGGCIGKLRIIAHFKIFNIYSY